MCRIEIMDFLLTVLCFGIFVGLNAQPAGNLNFVCRDGEEFDICRSPCEPTCDNIRLRNCSRPCVAGCFCRSGLVRSSDYTCVLPEDCNRPLCAENEVYLECGSACAQNCSNLNKGIFCAKPCHKGCFCKQNYVRNEKGKCVHRRNCTTAGNNQCPANEQYVDCVNFCNTCYNNPYCRDTPYCAPGCDCINGYYRNYYGQCVPAEECYNDQYGFQDQCGVNEIYTTCVNECNDCVSKGRCDNDCIAKSRCDNEQYYCTSGCDCKHGYFRNNRGVCIPEWSCYSQIQPNCPSGEQYYYCVPTCRTTCETYNDTNFFCDTTCTRGCHCTPGRVRRQDGVCVLPKDCPVRPVRCPQGEVFYQCLPTCRTTCRSLTSQSEVCSTECKPGCFCQPGFVRNNQRRCVRAENCPVPPTRVPPTRVPPACPTGEVFYHCVPCHITCGDLNSSCTQDCRPGCACEKGFVRGPDDRCIRPSNCPVVCGLNQEFLSCGSACPATCENFNERQVCTLMCVRGCFCKEGFVFGPNGRCIRPRNCPIRSTTVSNEGHRGGTDEDVLQNEGTSTPIASTRTNEGSRKNESASISSTETTSTLTSETQTDISNVSVSDSTERTTTVTEVTDVTTVSKSESDNTSPQSTEQATSFNPIETSPTNDATEKTTGLVTSAAETSTTKMTDSGTGITTVQVATSTVSDNATSVNSTAEP